MKSLPSLNSLYHSQSTLAFSNIFNQVKAGKTSDAETMLETGLFGLDQGSFMVNYGGTNTQQAAPLSYQKWLPIQCCLSRQYWDLLEPKYDLQTMGLPILL